METLASWQTSMSVRPSFFRSFLNSSPRFSIKYPVYVLHDYISILNISYPTLLIDVFNKTTKSSSYRMVIIRRCFVQYKKRIKHGYFL